MKKGKSKKRGVCAGEVPCPNIGIEFIDVIRYDIMLYNYTTERANKIAWDLNSKDAKNKFLKRLKQDEELNKVLIKNADAYMYQSVRGDIIKIWIHSHRHRIYEYNDERESDLPF